MNCQSSDQSTDQIQELGSKCEPTVVVTGFGLFGNYKANPSWLCVQRLKMDGINLVVNEIPVAYEDVDNYIEQIWNEFKPNLVIHCGVSSLAKCITLETRAVCHKNLYIKPDIYGRLPNPLSVQPLVSDNSINGEENECHSFRTQIDLNKVCEEVNAEFESGNLKMSAQLSSNAGRFLCEYIYRCSLEKSQEKTAFIHVPEITDNCPLEDIYSALEFTIKTIIKEVFKREI